MIVEPSMMGRRESPVEIQDHIGGYAESAGKANAFAPGLCVFLDVLEACA